MKCKKVWCCSLFILMLSVLLLSGCAGVSMTSKESGSDKQEKVYWSKKDRMFNAAVDAFFDAVDAKDSQAVKDLFSVRALENAENLDEEIEKLFAFYSGPTEKCERDGVGSEKGSNDHGMHIRSGSDWFAVVCDGANYYCHFTMVFENDMDREEIGVHSISVVSEKVICAEDFKFSAEAGLHAEADAPGDYQTRRIGCYPYVFVPIDRQLNKEEMLAFLEKETDFEVFRQTFGEPNAVTCEYLAYAYELPDENGEKRYMEFYVSKEQKITKAMLLNDVDIAYLELLWEAEKKK